MKLLQKQEAEHSLRRENEELVDQNLRLRDFWGKALERLRGAKDDYSKDKLKKMEEYEAFCAVAIAGLGALPDTILSRSVVIRMRRRAPGETVEPYRQRIHKAEGEKIGAQIAAWAATVVEGLKDAWPEMPPGVEDRNADVWEALLAVADAAGGKWPQAGREAAVALVADAKQSTPSLGVKLLEDLHSLFHPKTKDNTHLPIRDLISTEDILKGLAAIEESPWGDLKGKPIDSRRLARYLLPYGVKSKNVRIGDGIAKGYAREDLHDPWERYLPLHSPGTATSATSATNDAEVI